MRDRAADDLARAVAAGERRLRVDHFELHLAADEFERGVAHEHAGEEPDLAERLEAVADAEHEHAASAARLTTSGMIGERAAIAPERR